MLMNNKKKIWYSFLDIGGKSDDDHIGYYNNEDFSFVKLLEDNYEEIKAEVQEYIFKNENHLKPYFIKDLTTKENSWKSFAFSKWLWKNKENLKQCPQTQLILNKIPQLISASISIMEPNVQIKPHRGDTNATVRVHLALEAPAHLPDCGFEVNEEKTSWEEGKVFVFNDAALHAAWNLSDKRRYVLLIDVMRPEYVCKKYTICSMVLGGLVMQSILQKVPFLQKLPRFFQLIILYIHVVLINLVLRLKLALNL